MTTGGGRRRGPQFRSDIPRSNNLNQHFNNGPASQPSTLNYTNRTASYPFLNQNQGYSNQTADFIAQLSK